MHWGNTVFTTLKAVHVLLAVVWVGASAYMSLVVSPLLMRSTPAARQEILGRLGPTNLRFANALGGLTLLSGFALYWVQRDGFPVADMTGKWVLTALLVNLSVLFLLNYALRPTLRTLERLQKEARPGEPPSPMAGLLMKRLTFTGRLMLLLLLGAVVVMVVAAPP